MTNTFSIFDTFIFDFDGLLVNTEQIHYQSYLDMIKNEGFFLDWDFTTYLRFALHSTEALKNAVYASVNGLILHQKDWFKLREKKQKIYEKKLLLGDVKLMPGAKEFLQILTEKHKQLCVVTNSPRKQIDILKEQHPSLKTIPVWITREDYQKSKPFPDGYLKAVELLKPHRAVGFEDALKGILSLQQTPIQAVLIKPSYYPVYDKSLYQNVWEYSSIKEVIRDFTIS